MDKPLVSIKNLTVSVEENGQTKPIVDDVSFDVFSQSMMALVGESGSGKTTTALSIGRLLSSALMITRGSIFFEDHDILSMDENSLRAIRGKEIGFVFQEPLYAFNPLLTIGFQIEEVLQYHTPLRSLERQKKVLELLDLVKVKDPKRIAVSYPHQLSGGLRQRAMIAQAISASPKLIIADEPTSNLDVTLQAKIVELFKELREQLQLSILLITHDLGLVAHLADHVVVMKRGKIIERGSVKGILEHPQEEYTRQLLEATL